MDIYFLGSDGTIGFPPFRYGGIEKIVFQLALKTAEKFDTLL